MNKILKAIKYAFTRPEVILASIWLRLSPVIPAKLYLAVMYRLRRGYWMDFRNPVSFNEKLQWLKLNDHNPLYVKMVDKYEAKKYVAGIIGDEYIIPTIGVWENVGDIDMDSLPDQFVLKCTHDSGGLVICKDKSLLDWDASKKKLKQSLSKNYYNIGKEWPYKNVPKRVIAETYIKPETGKDDIPDYKFFCFNGEVKFFKIDFGRFKEHHANYYSPNGELLLFGEKSYPFDEQANLKLPDNLNDMILLAKKLSSNHPFVRVDFYNRQGKIYFGELTLYPASGFGELYPSKYDEIIGNYLFLPMNNR